MVLNGGTFFVDKTQDVVPIKYLEVLHDMRNIVPRYAWGAAALAHLRYHLGAASIHGVKQIASCLTLLKVKYVS